MQPINAEIRAGEFVVFFGPSGCGKSTLLNLIAGFEEPTEGEITLDGARVEGPHHDRLMLFQEHGLFPWLNVIENVLFGLKRQFRFKPKARRQKARQFLQMVHLDQFEKAPIHELSGGMKQRVALARALAPDPKVLLVDEPFPALDALTRTKLYGDLQEIFLRTQEDDYPRHARRARGCVPGGPRAGLLRPAGPHQGGYRDQSSPHPRHQRSEGGRVCQGDYEPTGGARR